MHTALIAEATRSSPLGRDAALSICRVNNPCYGSVPASVAPASISMSIPPHFSCVFG
jgi:hypothetical protein